LIFIFKYQYKLYIYMPQLVPFYFINQVSYGFLLLLILLYILSKYILPLFTQLQLTRIIIIKL
jgi:F-type H+-transporting ATPase subunit 8